MSDISVPWTIVAALAGAAAAWGAMRAEQAGLRRDLAEHKKDTSDRLLRHDNVLDEHGRAIHAIDSAAAEVRARVSNIAELKGIVVSQGEFTARMTAQDDALRELRIAVDRKVSMSAMPAAAPAPAHRPRAPSRPDR
jgi:hypothetical protein